MWKKILDYFTHVLTLAEATQSNKAEIKDVRLELRDLSFTVQELKHEIRALRNEQQHNLEKVVLSVENELLRFERRLPPERPPRNRGT